MTKTTLSALAVLAVTVCSIGLRAVGAAPAHGHASRARTTAFSSASSSTDSEVPTASLITTDFDQAQVQAATATTSLFADIVGGVASVATTAPLSSSLITFAQAQATGTPLPEIMDVSPETALATAAILNATPIPTAATWDSSMALDSDQAQATDVPIAGNGLAMDMGDSDQVYDRETNDIDRYGHHHPHHYHNNAYPNDGVDVNLDGTGGGSASVHTNVLPVSGVTGPGSAALGGLVSGVVPAANGLADGVVNAATGGVGGGLLHSAGGLAGGAANAATGVTNGVLDAATGGL